MPERRAGAGMTSLAHAISRGGAGLQEEHAAVPPPFALIHHKSSRYDGHASVMTMTTKTKTTKTIYPLDRLAWTGLRPHSPQRRTGPSARPAAVQI